MKQLAAIVILLAACKQAKEPTPASETIAKARALADKICACTTKACAEALRPEWDKLQLSGTTFTEDEAQTLVTIDDRALRCVGSLAP